TRKPKSKDSFDMCIFLVSAQKEVSQKRSVEDYKQRILRRKLKIDRAPLVGRRSASNFNDVDARSNSSGIFASPRLIARNHFSTFVKRPAKLFYEGLSRSQIGKAPTIINLPFPHDSYVHVAAECAATCENA